MTPILYMAPMRGLTDHLFRTVFTRHFGGFDLAVAPFISSKRDRVFKSGYVRDILPGNNPLLPVVPQILSKSADEFAALANYMYGFGYETVNWNLGCPFPMVAKKKRGSGLLPHPDLIRDFLDRTLPALKPALSIKIRLGWHDPEELFRLMPILNTYPLDTLIIHPRTGVQRYGGTVDLEAFGRCLSETDHRVVYNGDIRSAADLKQLAGRFPAVRRWMIGRGCLIDPFLALAIKSPEARIQGKIRKMKVFHAALLDAYSGLLSGPSHVLNKMKGFWQYFSLLFADCRAPVKQILKTRHPAHYLERVNRFFDTEARLLPGAAGPGPRDNA